MIDSFISSPALMSWLQSSTMELPLPSNCPSTSRRSSTASVTSLVDWINGKLESASETLQGNSVDDKSKTDDENVVFSAESSQVRQRKTVSPVSFPSYLNNNATEAKYTMKKYSGRRASLLDGIDQTIFETSNTRSVTVTSPLENTYKKTLLKKISGRLLTIHDGSEEFLELLPIPIYKFTEKDLLPTKRLYKPKNKKEQGSTARSVFILLIVFILSCLLVYTAYSNFPNMTEKETSVIKLPSNMEDAKALGRVLSKYKDTNYYEVITAFFITYIFLQTFAIPGSVFLSILSGFMYPFYLALFLVCLCSGIGATGCYFISHFIGNPLVHKYLEQRVKDWNEKVDGHRGDLFNYLLFLRITPFLPNWFINIVSPIINIPVSTFFTATFIGVAPLSFIAIQAGTTLYQLTTAGDALSTKSIAAMAILAVLSLVPVIIKRYKVKDE